MWIRIRNTVVSRSTCDKVFGIYCRPFGAPPPVLFWFLGDLFAVLRICKNSAPALRSRNSELRLQLRFDLLHEHMSYRIYLNFFCFNVQVSTSKFKLK
jgi:hypothetical protein